MSYFRKMIYLQEEGQGRGGYIKVSGKREWIRLEIHLNHPEKWENSPVMLVVRGPQDIETCIAGNTDAAAVTKLECKVNERQELIGIWIGENGKPQMGEGEKPVIEQMEKPELQVKSEPVEEPEHVDEPEANREQKEEILETTQTEELPEFIEVEMEEEHDWEYECRKILENRTAMYPFSDDEVDQCVQIGPEDFGEFPSQYWTLSENPFLKQGLYHFGHLLFAKVGDSMFVGVPGRYHKRDACLGRTYGFSYFKSVHKSKLQMGDFGYWMMEVHPQPLQVRQEGWESTSSPIGKWNISESNIPPEEGRRASEDLP